MKNKKLHKHKPCVYCSVASVKYKCAMCDGTGKIEIPKNIVWHGGKLSNFTTQGTYFIPCDQCKGKGWILVPPFIADRYPHNKL